MEMFFISLFARYCFRRVEPKRCGQVETRNKSSQTALRDLYTLCDDVAITNSSYVSEGEETLCHIEHAPLDTYDFLQYQYNREQGAGEPQLGHQEGKRSELELGNMSSPREVAGAIDAELLLRVAPLFWSNVSFGSECGLILESKCSPSHDSNSSPLPFDILYDKLLFRLDPMVSVDGSVPCICSVSGLMVQSEHSPSHDSISSLIPFDI
ncbi:hypothetical protein GDO86_018370 [Hymenochirus boettgeri]|uniref:Uncharacterized protein n=1 Tax=Hymenochirus boettgeri TaxID=247094 RepID=A0A8T2IHS2_9PIPI|nr:hypothetical protein GDO86_018370 [Hymenochirus boettgeri]